METKQELIERIREQVDILLENNDGTTKVSQKRARKAASALKNLMTPYKKASVTEEKLM